MKRILLRILFSLAVASYCSTLFSQDSVPEFPEGYKRNTIKWNMTPFLLWGSANINLSYERVLSSNRSFSVNAGYFVLPSSGLYDSLNISTERKKAGFTVSGDYRFYLSKRNRHPAPDGIFWGVYGSFHHYQFQNDVSVINSDAVQGSLLLDGRLNIISAGVELGYQFVIKERFSVDLIFMGPSLSAYNTGMTLEGKLDINDHEEYIQAIYDLLSARYPGFSELVTTGERNSKGAKTSMGFGLRYLIQIGYRF